MPTHHTKLIIPTLLAAISLVGCGEGTDGTSQNSANKHLPKAGEAYTTSILVNDKPVNETVYTIYSVADDQGKLTDVPLSDPQQEAQLPHVLIKQSTNTLAKVSKDGTVTDLSGGPKKLSPAIPLAKIEHCYANIWSKLKIAKPEATRQELAFGIAQFGVSIDDLCTYASASGMSLDEYVEMFQTVSKHYPGRPNVEADMVRFFIVLNVTPKTFLRALSEKGYTWDDFITKLAANKSDADMFINSYANSGMTLTQYIGDYMHRPGPATAALNRGLKLASAYLTKDAAPGFLALTSPKQIFAETITSTIKDITDATNDVIDTVNKGLAVGKQVWEILRDNVAVVNLDGSGKGNNADVSTSILSEKDRASINYGYAKSSTSPVVSFVGRTLWWEDYRLDFMLDADYDARNPSAPGQWLPNINVKFKHIQAGYGYRLNGSAKVSNTVNRGSPDEPIPEAQIEVIVSVSDWSVLQQSFTFVANGATGASIK